jgi:RimJ/RimL family protein N-acetyltransferase
VGYWVAPWARRQGVATRAARAVCRWALDDGPFERLSLQAATINPGSNGVARALGFTLEGTLRGAMREGGTDTPSRLDMHVWGLLPGELT